MMINIHTELHTYNTLSQNYTHILAHVTHKYAYILSHTGMPSHTYMAQADNHTHIS